MATRVNYPLFKAFTAAGTFAIGYKLYTYEAGTSTPLTVYQDEAGTVPHTNPIILNALGEEEIYITQAAKFTLTDANGNIQTGWPVDDIDPVSITADQVGYTPSGSLTADNVQDAIDDLVQVVDELDTNPGPLAIKVFTSSGTYTPTTGAQTAVVEVVGGGGGGGGGNSGASTSGSGGSAGGYAKKIVSLDGITTETVTIGAAGTGGAASTDGTAGSTTSFGAHVSATGGGKGKYNAASDAAGTGVGGDINLPGGRGSSGREDTGGASFFGYGGCSTTGNTTIAGQGYGAGGAGDYNGIVTGGGKAGTAGICIVTEY